MASTTESQLRQTLSSLATISPTSPQATTLLKAAKHHLLRLNALIPSPTTSPQHLSLARSTLEAGALLSIRAQNADAFTRYYQQLQAFYELPARAFRDGSKGGSGGGGSDGQKSKITGLYLMLLLTKGDYAGFHTVLEGLEMEQAVQNAPSSGGQAGKTGAGGAAGKRGSRALSGDKDRFLQYPVMLEQWLMEGAYDRVWNATKREGVPGEEFGVFSEILIHTIRSEIASCSEKAYPSVPVSSAKTLFFLESEGAVVGFARERGWVVRDGRIYFPAQSDGVRNEREILVASGVVIENTIGYARELETIV